MSTSTQETTPSLKFKAYTRDPLANFLIELGWPRWKYGLIYAAATLCLFTIAAIVYVTNDDLDK